MKVTNKTTIGEILASAKNGREVLGGFGLHCFGCPMSQMETIEQAAGAHHIQLDFMLKKLNEDLVFETKKEVSSMACSCGCKTGAKSEAAKKPADKKAPAKKK